MPTLAMRPETRIHPLAWWMWAIALTFAASATTSTWLLGIISAGAIAVALRFRSDGPWRHSINYAIYLAFTLLLIRLTLAMLFGAKIPGHVLFTLPSVRLPEWLSGIALGGEVTSEKLLTILREGFKLATLVIIFGAASSLTRPKELLKSLPRALHEAGVIVVVSTTFLPQIISSIKRIRTAQRLRGSRANRGLSLTRVLIPVIEDALTKSLDLAAAMESRGYGRTHHRARHRLSASLLIFGLLGLVAGIYLLLVPNSLVNVPWLILTLAAAVCVLGLWLSGRNLRLTVYRPINWNLEAIALPLLGASVAAMAGIHFQSLTSLAFASALLCAPFLYLGRQA
ncbi:MAG: energy-coupling factor transporter transmembrane component T [Actinomycetes bacterium]